MRRFDDSVLGTQKIGRLLARMSIPATVAMLVNATYNLVDTIYIGRGVGTDGIGALALAFPVQMILMAAAGLLGFGAASVVSRSLGAKDTDRAATATGTALGLALITAVASAAAGLLALEPLLALLGASEQLSGLAGEYLSMILLGTPFITTAMAASHLIRAEGRAQFAMIIMVIGTGLNIVLDPIFIFALDMGVRGAATATVVSQFCSFLFVIYYYVTRRGGLGLRLRHLVPSRSVLGEIIALGIPAFVRQGGMSVITVLINNALGYYGGDIYISAYGAIFRLLMFVLMPIFGVVQGFQPIAGYNYGARKLGRVRRVVTAAVAVTTGVNLLTFTLMMVVPRTLLGMFTTDPALLDVSVRSMRVMILFVPLIGLQSIGAGLFQVIGKPVPAILLGMSRQFLLLIPLVLILPRFFGVPGVFAAFPLADVVSTAITTALLLREMRGMRREELAAGAPSSAAPAISAAADTSRP